MVDAAQPYSKAERLLNLLMALRGSRVGLTREDIRKVVRGYNPTASPEAFERMFERDKDQLRGMGVPVVTLTDASGVVTGYRIEGDWTLPPLDLDRAELAVLGLAARVWQRADLAPAALNALRKVEARLGVQAADGPAPIAGLSTDSTHLTELIRACSTRTPVVFGYRKAADGQATPRHVQPWSVVWWRAHWYLVGHDTDRGDVRVFRASRIEGPVRPDPDGAAFDVPEGFDGRAAVGRFRPAQVLELDLALAPGVGAGLRRGAQPRGTDPDGWDRVRLQVEDLVSGVAAALALAPAVRVDGPPQAVAEAVRQRAALIAAHQTPAPRAGRAQSASPSGPGAEQFSRLLALVPWLAANSGVSMAEAAAHFGITEDQLREDLDSVITSGADDWTLFDIQYWEDGGVIEVIDALDLAEPLSLTPDEGFALVVALDALAGVPGEHDREVLASVTAKVSRALGEHAPAPGALAVRIDLPDEVVAPVEQAIAAGRAVELTYLGAVRDEITQRVVDPLAIVVVDGYGYLRAYCRSAQGLRLFRLDRVLEARVSVEPAQQVDAGEDSIEPMAVSLAATGMRVVVDVAPGTGLLDRHPSTRRWALPDGWVRAELPVGDYRWARRLVLSGAGQVVLREPSWLVAHVVSDARATRVASADLPDEGPPSQ